MDMCEEFIFLALKNVTAEARRALSAENADPETVKRRMV
jgi:hypothetical protein